jgi:hypothetical protein
VAAGKDSFGRTGFVRAAIIIAQLALVGRLGERLDRRIHEAGARTGKVRDVVDRTSLR